MGSLSRQNIYELEAYIFLMWNLFAISDLRDEFQSINTHMNYSPA